MRNNIFFNTFPPHNVLAEELFLGIILINIGERIIDDIKSQISTNALVLESHQIIYQTVIDHKKYNKSSLIELVHYLSEERLLNKIGGLEKILELINQILSFQKMMIPRLNLNCYIEIVQEKYVRRLIIQWASYITQLSLSESITLNLILKQANKYIEEIFLLVKQKNTFDLPNILSSLLKNLEKNQKTIRRLNTTGLKCGFISLDKLTQGFQPADLIIIAGRPAMGKTSIALNITNYILQNSNGGVTIFSFEMSKQQILYRLISIQCEITTHKLRSGTINVTDLINIKQSCQVIVKSSFYIDDNPNITIFELHLITKKIVKKTLARLIIIDYLQLIQSQDLNFKNRVQELSSITRTLKILAREISTPIIVLSQLNRNVENRINKRPLLSDLRESGCIKGRTLIINNNLSKIVQQLIVHFQYYVESIQSIKQPRNKFLAKTFFKELQYTYSLNFNSHQYIYTTNNHKILTINGWKKGENLLKFEKIINAYYLSNKKFISHNIQFYKNLSSIRFIQYEPVYDIKTNHLLNFTNQQVILHNSIEQDADLVLFLYRDDYYNHHKTYTKIAEIIIAKHRNGPTGSFELYFDSSCTIFSNC